MLGKREPEIYGKTTLEQINKKLVLLGKELNVEVETFFSNIEGEIVEAIQKSIGKVAAIIINPAGYSHSSVAIRDALSATKLAVYEVHISNIFAREPFRAKSLISEIAEGVITGFGPDGYALALRHASEKLNSKK